MASIMLYPPVVDSYMPAFQVGDEQCRIYFRLSRYNISTDFQTVHASVYKQGTGTNVVKKVNDEIDLNSQNKEIRYRTTGIIINMVPHKVAGEDDLYYVTIGKEELSPSWTVGWTYKIQLRLSKGTYNGNGQLSSWLNSNANSFSEWSTVCVLKVTGDINYKIPILDIDKKSKSDSANLLSKITEVESTTLDLSGHFIREDKTEPIHSYRFILYNVDNDTVPIEDSGEIYCDKYQDIDSFKYLFKTELENEKVYNLVFKYETINKFSDSDTYTFSCLDYKVDAPPCIVTTIEDSEYIETTEGHTHHNKELEDLQEENEEARIALKLVPLKSGPQTCNICIRRSDSNSVFKEWVDLFIYQCNNQSIEDIPIFYDYTIESGVFYKYGVQIINTSGIRGSLIAQSDSTRVVREFEHSYLLGKNDKQLKFKFNNDMNNFKYQIYDSKIDPIGSKYPIVARNAKTYYRTFPINGLISFNMDESMSFSNRYDVIGNDIVDKVEQKSVVDWYGEWKYGEYYYNRIYKDKPNHFPELYDYTYEKKFRDKVLEFLQDGEVKLYKSATEGNILVRLTDVTCTPVQSLNRLLYNFSATAFEVQECSMENYINYGLHVVGDWAEDFSIKETKLGQITAEIDVSKNSTNNDITKLIMQKYDTTGQNVAGYSTTLTGYHHIKITFEDKPLKILPSGGSAPNDYVMGNKMEFKGQEINVYAPNRIYEFDHSVSCGMQERFIIAGDYEGEVNKVNVTVDFLYDYVVRPYASKIIKSQKLRRGVGQLFQHCRSGENLFFEIYLKYYLETDRDFSKLMAFNAINIEATPGAVFSIRDSKDNENFNNKNIHVVGATGRLSLMGIENINGLIYNGIQDPSTGEIKKVDMDILIDYFYIVQQGTYKQTNEEVQDG